MVEWWSNKCQFWLKKNVLDMCEKGPNYIALLCVLSVSNGSAASISSHIVFTKTVNRSQTCPGSTLCAQKAAHLFHFIFCLDPPLKYRLNAAWWSLKALFYAYILKLLCVRTCVLAYGWLRAWAVTLCGLWLCFHQSYRLKLRHFSSSSFSLSWKTI